MTRTKQKQKRLRSGKKTQKNCTRKVLMSQITMMIGHSESDFLECDVKWVLRRITMNKASEGDEIPAELFQILKMMLLKVHTICQQIWKSQQWPQDFFHPIPNKGNAKECSNYHTIALISHLAR